MAMLFMLYHLQAPWQWTLRTAHCNHMWHPSSINTASRVAQVSLAIGVPTVIGISGGTVEGETDARIWRWRCLHRICRLHGVSRICTAHTASDRVETLITQLARGTRGGMGWWRLGTYPVVRPVLGLARAEISQYSHRCNLPLCVDGTNRFLHGERARIRHELLPYLRRWWHPGIDECLVQAAEQRGWDHAHLELVAHQLSQSYEWIGRDGVRIQQLVMLPEAIRNRVNRCFVRRALALCLPQASIVPWRVRQTKQWLLVCNASSWIRTSDDMSDYESDALDH